ncbi:hypothetical protein E6O75_ATG07691, partial [Venturia nashicola]
LHYTVTDEDLEIDTDWICKQGATTRECQKSVTFNGRPTMFWADLLKSVHPQVEDDVCLVMKTWKSRGQELADKKPGTGCEEHDLLILMSAHVARFQAHLQAIVVETSNDIWVLLQEN